MAALDGTTDKMLIDKEKVRLSKDCLSINASISSTLHTKRIRNDPDRMPKKFTICALSQWLGNAISRSLPSLTRSSLTTWRSLEARNRRARVARRMDGSKLSSLLPFKLLGFYVSMHKHQATCTYNDCCQILLLWCNKSNLMANRMCREDSGLDTTAIQSEEMWTGTTYALASFFALMVSSWKFSHLLTSKIMTVRLGLW